MNSSKGEGDGEDMTSPVQGRGLLLITAVMFCAQSLQSEPATEGLEIFINRNFARKPIPQWNGGYLLGYELYPLSAPPVFAYDRNGTKLFERSLVLEGAHEVFLRSTAASRDGRFAFSGTAVSAAGARVGFIAFLGKVGRLIQVVRPERFYPQHSCFTADGTLWVAGTVGSDKNRVEEDHNVLRAYSSHGTLKFSLLPRSSFAPVSRDRGESPHPAVDGRTLSALATNDKVVVFLAAAFQELISVSLDGKVLLRTPTELPSYDFITGLAVGPDGQALISSEKHASSESTKEAEFAFYRFNPLNGSWIELYSRPTRESGVPKAISLVDGNQMLVKIDEDRFRWMSRLP
jgi:hypothetical protein